jgi:uridine kinase
LGQVEAKLRPLYAFTLRLLADDAKKHGFTRIGSAEGVLSSCEQHHLVWQSHQVGALKRNDEMRVHFFQSLEQYFPVRGRKQQVIEKPGLTYGPDHHRANIPVVSFAALYLVRTYLMHLNRHNEQSIEDQHYPLLIVDGFSGVGKTTLCREVIRLLKEAGHEVEIWGLDVGLKERAWRLDMERRLATGEIDPDTYDEADFSDWPKIISMLSQLAAIRCSASGSGEVTVANAYDSKSKTYQDVTFQVKRRKIIIIEGKYANRGDLQEYYGKNPLRVRYRANPEEIRERYRTRPNPGADMAIRMVFYDHSVVPSFERYDERTRHLIDTELNVSPADDDDMI